MPKSRGRKKKDAKKPRRTGSAGADRVERMPEYEPTMFGALGRVPVEALPLYAALAVVHQHLSGAPPNVCVPVCYQLAGTLVHLGFEAEVMAACATVMDREDQQVRFADLGVWDRPPRVRPDGTTDGHVVLWAESFHRLVDPTIVQSPKLLAASHRDPTFTHPVILPMASREQLVSSYPATVKGPFLISWDVQPEWTSHLASMLDGDLGEALPYGSLVLAHEVVEIVRATERHRPPGDAARLRRLYPRMDALLDHREELPPIPDEPPPAALRVLGPRR